MSFQWLIIDRKGNWSADIYTAYVVVAFCDNCEKGDKTVTNFCVKKKPHR